MNDEIIINGEVYIKKGSIHTDPMNIKELVQKAYKMACDKGWHDEKRQPLEAYALMHSEISEAVEAARLGAPPIYQEDKYYGRISFSSYDDSGKSLWSDTAKPEGELIELADTVIRIADHCGSMGWDLEHAIKMKMHYNSTRPYKHGKKL